MKLSIALKTAMKAKGFFAVCGFSANAISADSNIEAKLEQLRKEREALNKSTQAFDKRINALEKELKKSATVNKSPLNASTSPMPMAGRYEPGKGFVLARSELGELDFSVFTYIRYLNQTAMDDTYTDSFGRTKDMDLRNDLQFQKVTLNFKGWVFDPRFTYLFYAWTSNTSQGDPAQVVIAGNIGYKFNEHFSLKGGIGALPSTRSTNNTFPNWLKNDHRTIADEYFRASYTTGIWASGEIREGLEYIAMIGNNLSQLGVNASQLDNEFNTISGAITWMPTTGEYGPGKGMGDYEFHDELATQVGLHFTHSREDAQGQPGTEGFENSQIRLSDGTLIFSDDPFETGGSIRKATYQMMALNGGFKLKGWSLEAEYYHRWVDDFEATGPIPVTELDDDGLQIQGSTMFIPKILQGYVAYSKIMGEYGNPSDVSLGVNWFPMERKEFRISTQALYTKDSPVGYSSVPFASGGNGWAFTTDVILAF